LVLLALCTSPLHAQLPPDCQAGVRSYASEDLASAMPALSRCLDLQISTLTRARILRVRGEALAKLSRFQEALDDQKQSLLLAEPEDAWPLIALSIYHRNLKQYDEALSALERAKQYDKDGLGTEPEMSAGDARPGMSIWFQTGLTLKEMGQYQKAINAFTSAVPKQPEYSPAYYYRSLCYEALGDRVHAKEDLGRAYGLSYPSERDPEFLAKLAEYGIPSKPSSHEQAVEELFQLMGLKRALLSGMAAGFNALVKRDPTMATYRGVWEEWAARVMTWESIGPPLIQRYIETFSEPELREMIAFYSTPTGRRALTQLPGLLAEGEAIGIQLGKSHQAELQEAMRIRKQQLETEAKP